MVVVRAFDPTDPSLPTGGQVELVHAELRNLADRLARKPAPRRISGTSRIMTSLQPARVRLNVDLVGLDQAQFELILTAKPPTIDETAKTVDPLKSSAGVTERGQQAASLVLDSTLVDPILWTPESPSLYEATLELKDAGGKVVDAIQTYFGLRTIGRGKVGDEPFERIL